MQQRQRRGASCSAEPSSAGSRVDTQFNGYSHYADICAYWGMTRAYRERLGLDKVGIAVVDVRRLDGVVELYGRRREELLFRHRAHALAEDSKELLALSSPQDALTQLVPLDEICQGAITEDVMWAAVAPPAVAAAFRRHFVDEVLSPWVTHAP